MKRLALFLDGTWNEPGDNTNVWRLKSTMASQDGAGVRQKTYYDQGVGTEWYDRIRGGAAGRGLSANVREAYQWLMEQYEDSDEIYLFGFSRGAFTARSLAGMISRCGLLTPGAPIPVAQLFDRYASGARPIYRLPETVPRDAGRYTLEDRWVIDHCRRVRIKLIGVWDTVGALGIKVRRSRREHRGEFAFHHTRLSASYDHAAHALAIDEHRKPYRHTMWYRFIPGGQPGLPFQPPPQVEQRWFSGAHSQVGGGYQNDELAQLPLAWMQAKARGLGLAFRYSIAATGDEHRAPLIDSYARFFKGAYRVATLGRRHQRTIGEGRTPVTGGWIEPVAESIDASVFERWRHDPTYRPRNLAEWATRTELDPAALFGHQPCTPLPSTSAAA